MCRLHRPQKEVPFIIKRKAERQLHFTDDTRLRSRTTMLRTVIDAAPPAPRQAFSMSVTFVKRNKPTDKSWQVTLQGKVRPRSFCAFLRRIMSSLTASPLFLFALLPQVFKETGHGAPHVETQEEVRQPGCPIAAAVQHPCITLNSSCQVCKCTQLQRPCSIRDNPSRYCNTALRALRARPSHWAQGPSVAKPSCTRCRA